MNRPIVVFWTICALPLASAEAKPKCTLPLVSEACAGVVPLGWSKEGALAFAVVSHYGEEAGCGPPPAPKIMSASSSETAVFAFPEPLKPTRKIDLSTRLHENGFACDAVRTCEHEADLVVREDSLSPDGLSMRGLYLWHDNIEKYVGSFPPIDPTLGDERGARPSAGLIRIDSPDGRWRALILPSHPRLIVVDRNQIERLRREQVRTVCHAKDLQGLLLYSARCAEIALYASPNGSNGLLIAEHFNPLKATGRVGCEIEKFEVAGVEFSTRWIQLRSHESDRCVAARLPPVIGWAKVPRIALVSEDAMHERGPRLHLPEPDLPPSPVYWHVEGGLPRKMRANPACLWERTSTLR